MKIISLNTLLLLTIILLNNTRSLAQQIKTDAQNKNISRFIQIWGLVKYRSEKSIFGHFDADQQFLMLFDTVKNADNKHFNQLMASLVGQNATSIPAKHDYGIKPDNYRHLIKNINDKWISNSSYTSELRKQLMALSTWVNRSGKHQYIPAVWYENELPNEASYTDYNFKDEKMNVLALAKAWNAIEYLFPYKYRMDIDWAKVLREMIPVFRMVTDRTGYERSVLMLAASINDTHAGELMDSEKLKMTTTIFNVRYYPPFDYKAEPWGIIVKKLLNDSLAKVNTLKAGDVIVGINGVKIKRWLEERADLLAVSNSSVKYRELSTSNNNRGDTFAFNNLDSGTLNVRVKRGKAFMDLKLIMLDRQNKQHISLIEQDITQKRLKEKSIAGREDIGEDIVLFRAGNFFDKDLPLEKDLIGLSGELKRKKALIFDMRKYPQSPGLFSYYIPLLLGKAPFAFARYYEADPKYPGTFLLREGAENYMHVSKEGIKPIGSLYSGRIVILTDENTQSMGEWFTMMLSQINVNTTIIGSQTAGADGDLKRMSLPGGYHFSFTGAGIFYPDGRETQRIGIKPNIHFKPSNSELSGSEDAHLELAVRFIREGK